MAFSTDSNISLLGLFTYFDNFTSCKSGCGKSNAKLLCLRSGKRVCKRKDCKSKKGKRCCC